MKNTKMFLSSFVLIIFLSGVSYSNPNDQCLIHWTFDEMAGDTLHDISGNGNHGIVHDASWVNGYQGGALSFDGTDDYVSTNFQADFGTSAFTVEGYFKTNSTKGMIVMGNYSGDSRQSGFFIGLNHKFGPGEKDEPGILTFFIRDNNFAGQHNQAQYDGDYNDGNFHHFVAIRDESSNMLLYVDNVLVATDNAGVREVGAEPNNNNFALGRASSEINYSPFEGVIDNVRIYNYAITQNLLIHWTFDEMSGDTLHDISGNGNHGIVHDASWVNGYQGGALSFDGTDDYVSTNFQADFGTSAFTVEGYFKTNSTKGMIVMGNYSGDSRQSGFFIGLNHKFGPGEKDEPGILTFFIRDNNFAGQHNQAQYDGDYNDGNFHHFVAIRDESSNMLLYVDNVLVATDNAGVREVGAEPNNNNFALGRASSEINYSPFEGVIDNVRIYNDAIIPTSVETSDMNLKSSPNCFNLYQNYPNPFNPITTISFYLQKPNFVEIKIFNTMGQEISMLLNSEKLAGNFKIVWDGRNKFGLPVSSGIYFYQIKVNDFVKARKMILMR